MAFQSLQSGVDQAYSMGCEVWVAAGTYGVAAYASGSLEMRGAVRIYGGFSSGDAYFEDREPLANPPILDGQNTAYHVVACRSTTYGCTTGAVLNGFVLTRGYASVASASNNYGGGLFVNAAVGKTPQFGNLVVSGNRALRAGAGIAVVSGNASFDSITVTNNRIDVDGNNGGGVYASGGTTSITNGVIAGNQADYYGGGLYGGGSGTLACNNCVIAGNYARRESGGGVGGYSSTIVLANSTVYRNRANDGGAIYASQGSLNIVNSILWANTHAAAGANYILPVDITPVVLNSIVQGGYAGAGNLTDDPKLVLDGTTDHTKGTVEAVAFDATTFLTKVTLTDPTPNGTQVQLPGDLVGTLLRPDNSDPRLFPIVENDGVAAWIRGDVTSLVAAGDIWELRDLHLGSNSPAMDYANTGLSPAPLSTDLDGKARFDSPFKAGGPTDIGAYESRGCALFVRPLGLDTNDGLSWGAAKRNPETAVDLARDYAAQPTTYAPDGFCEVWLLSGDYYLYSRGVLSLRNGVKVYGGFSGDETSRRQREWGPALDETALSACDAAACSNRLTRIVECDNVGGPCGISSALDGVTIAGATVNAVYVNGQSSGSTNAVVLANLSVSGNTSTGSGGPALSLTGSKNASKIHNCSFSSNVATNGNGGAVYVNGSAAPRFDYCRFDSNTSSQGGAMYIADSATSVTIRDSSFSFNEASDGGAIYGYSASVLAQRTRFDNNWAANYGGAIYFVARTSAGQTLRECWFQSNEAGDRDITFPVDPCGILSSDSSSQGGAIAVVNGQADVFNSLFSNNSARTGGALWNSNASNVILNVYGSTFVSNCAAYSTGGPVFFAYGAGNIYNSIFWNNGDVTTWAPIQDWSGSTWVVDVNYSDVQNGWTGTSSLGHNLNIDPGLDASFSLMASSPCIDAAYGLEGLPTYDYDGATRTDNPSVPNTGAGTPAYYDMGARESPPPPPIYVWSIPVTSGNLGGRSGADAKCQADLVANYPSRAGMTAHALICTSDPHEAPGFPTTFGFEGNAAVYSMNDTKLASTWAAMMSGLDVSLYSAGVFSSSLQDFFTGCATPSGNCLYRCSAFTSSLSTENACVGRADFVNDQWIAWGNIVSCNTASRIMCFAHF
jgi:predicted outer membrane repeat protein